MPSPPLASFKYSVSITQLCSPLYTICPPWIMPYALHSYPICHLWPYALWQLCIHFHLLCPICLRPQTSRPLQQSYNPASSNLKGLDISDVRSISDVLSPPEPRQPWNHDDTPSLISSTPPPATHPLWREANSKPTTMSSTPTFVNSETPTIRHFDAWSSRNASYVILPGFHTNPESKFFQ